MFHISVHHFAGRNSSGLRDKGARHFRILFAAGGTGGHIMPALATAESIGQVSSNIECQFICGRKPIELALFRKAGWNPVILPLDGVTKGILGISRRILQTVSSIHKAMVFQKEWKPDAVIAFGGYSSVPTTLAAKLQGIPIYLHEQNSIPGKANRFLSRFAKKIFCGFSKTSFRTSKRNLIFTGNPIRSNSKGYSREEGRRYYSIPLDSFLLLAFGGSQGALRLNTLLVEALKQMIDHRKDSHGKISILWGTGESNYQFVCDLVRKTFPVISFSNYQDKAVLIIEKGSHKIAIHLYPFLKEMGLAYAAADLVLSRSGASTIAEILANHLPAIFVPYPHAVQNHQFKNAEIPVQEGAALLIHENNTHASAKLESSLWNLISMPGNLMEMKSKSEKIATPDAGQTIAYYLFEDWKKRLEVTYSSIKEPNIT